MNVPSSAPISPDSTSANQTSQPHTDYHQLDRTKLSPMYQHYVQVKEQYPHTLLLYRCGDFFETFFQDAVIVSRELELVLTSKHGGNEIGRVAMTGVPHHALERYCTMLVEKAMRSPSAIKWKMLLLLKGWYAGK